MQAIGAVAIIGDRTILRNVNPGIVAGHCAGGPGSAIRPVSVGDRHVGGVSGINEVEHRVVLVMLLGIVGVLGK